MNKEMTELFIYTTISLFVFSRVITLFNINPRKQLRVTFKDNTFEDNDETSSDDTINDDTINDDTINDDTIMMTK